MAVPTMQPVRYGAPFAAICLLAATSPAGSAEIEYRFLDGQADGSFDVALALTIERGWPRDGFLALAFNRQDAENYYHVRIKGGRVEILKVRDGAEEVIGGPAPVRPPQNSAAVLTLKRRPWRISLLQDGQLLCQAYDDEFDGGKVGYAFDAGGVELEDPFIQPVAPIHLTDDFTRDPDEPGEWETVSGDWRTSGPEAEAVENVELSANPFAYQILNPQNALTTIGYDFGDDYVLETSVRGGPQSAVGLCARLQNEGNYLLFRWAAAMAGAGPAANARQLVEVVGGKWRMLASEPGGYVPDRWYRLRLRVQGETASVFIDGAPVISHESVTLLAGKAGLYATGGKRTLFDDLRIDAAGGLRDHFSGGDLRPWQSVDGRWSVNQGRLKGAAPRGAAMAVGGSLGWRDVSFACNARPSGGGALGVLFRYRDDRNHYLFRWGTKGPQTAYPGRKQLVKVAGGKKEVLAEADGVCTPDGWHQIHVLLRGGHMRVYTDGELAVESADGALPTGRVGFYGEATKGVAFDDAAITVLDSRRRGPRVIEQFAKESTMSGWASPAGAWVEDDDVFWNRAALYGPSSVIFRLPREARSAGSVAALLRGDGKEPESGYQLGVATKKGSSEVTVSLKRREETIGTRNLDLGGGGGSVEVVLSQRGRQVFGEVDGVCALQLSDPEPLVGIHGGIEVRGVAFDLKDADVYSEQLRDYTFAEAPTDWAAQTGTWQTVDRWPCYKGWAWFGGVGHKVPLLWSKRVFEGDMTLEFYGAIQMDLPKEPGYSHASDINCTIAGDGQRISSGYSFIFAGFGNKASAILRKGEVVAKTSKFRFDNPVSMNVKTFQRHWFHVRAQRLGSRLRFYIDDELALEYDDPEPLPGGRVGFWTWDNGLIIARARVSYEKGGQVVPLPAPSELPRSDVPYSLYEG